MHKRFAWIAVVVAGLGSGASYAGDRAVTSEEGAQLSAALQAIGCSGGKMEFDTDDTKFEVDDATCADGRTYDLDFDSSFKLLRKERD